jgi:GABA(A) receptor-associated protein
MWKYLVSKPRPSKTSYEFKLRYPFDRREKESQRIRQKYSDKIPIVLEKAETSDVPVLDKTKYLVPEDLTVGQFMFTIRQKIKLDSSESIFFFVNNEYIPAVSETMSELYNNKKDADGFLYITYSKMEAFGK